MLFSLIVFAFLVMKRGNDLLSDFNVNRAVLGLNSNMDMGVEELFFSCENNLLNMIPNDEVSLTRYERLSYYCYFRLVQDGYFQNDFHSISETYLSFFMPLLVNIDSSKIIPHNLKYGIVANLVWNEQHNDAWPHLLALKENKKISSNSRGQIFSWIAEIDKKQDDVDSALKNYDQALELNPHLVEAYFYLFENAYKDEQIELAKSYAETLYHLEPTYYLNNRESNKCVPIATAKESGISAGNGWFLIGYDLDEVLSAHSPLTIAKFYWVNIEQENNTIEPLSIVKLEQDNEHVTYQIANKIIDVRVIRNLVPDPGFAWQPLQTGSGMFERGPHTRKNEDLSISILATEDIIFEPQRWMRLKTTEVGAAFQMDSKEFPVEPGVFYLQGGSLRTKGDDILTSFGRSYFSVEEGEYFRSWRAANEINTNGEWIYCSGPFKETAASSVKVQWSTSSGIGTMDVSNLHFFELPLLDFLVTDETK
ncbi:MAG: tetratricopeptide repeat protein [Chloroflexi bacterium]|nr:MAG: tetratricopeptide repeat protein [Chloroflexota bacterium]